MRTDLKYIEFSDVPYREYEALKGIDLRCMFAIHMLLKESVENNNPFVIFDKVIDYTMGLESLYLLREEDGKAQKLCSRASTLLSKDNSERARLCKIIRRFYGIRSGVVHGSLVRNNDMAFVSENIYNYEEILRQSIVAFFGLNRKQATKKAVLYLIDKSKRR